MTTATSALTRHPVQQRLCGPPGMAAGVRRALKEACLPDRQPHGERFDF